MENIDLAFLINTRYRHRNGRHLVECKKGLFSIDAGTKKEAYREAKHYFVQYFSDGEYDEP